MVRLPRREDTSAHGRYWEKIAKKQTAEEGLRQMEHGFTPDVGPSPSAILPPRERIDPKRAQAEKMWQQMTQQKNSGQEKAA